MKYFQFLTERDIQTICQIYPYKEMIQGFKKNPRAFNDIARGYRPQAIPEDRGRKLLVENCHSKLVINMIDGLLDRWIINVNQHIEECIKAGDTENAAYIKAFQASMLPDSVELYFRLTGKTVSEEYVSVLSAAIAIVASEKQKNSHTVPIPSISPDDLEQERKRYRSEIRAKDSESKKKSKEIDSLNSKITELSVTIETLQGASERQIDRIKYLEKIEAIQKKKLNDTISENNILDAELRKRKAELREAQAAVDTAKKRENVQQATISSLQGELSDIQRALAEVDAKIYCESDALLCPIDMEEFSEYLGYNLRSIGVNNSTDDYLLLADFLGDILFQNKPIICNRIVGIALAKCVSNALCGSQEIKILSYTSEVTCKDILNYLKLENRICILDGFLGNFNEMELISLFSSIKGKIIFITLDYERTMAYLPQEILLYFNYLNVNRIKGFFSEVAVDEDSSLIPEEWTLSVHKSLNGRAERLCNEIMKQLGFGDEITALISQRMTSEEKLVQYLAFSILPYSMEAFDCRPYETSDRLQKYAGEQGKCKQKSLLLGWFGNE